MATNPHANPPGPPGPPSPPPGPPAPSPSPSPSPSPAPSPPGQSKPPKRPVKIGGKDIPPGQLDSRVLPNGKVLVMRAGQPTAIVDKLRNKGAGKWKKAKVDALLAALTQTHEPDVRPAQALEREGLKPINRGPAV